MKKIIQSVIFLMFLFIVPTSFAQEVTDKFTGQEQDANGLYYYNSRYYDADLGRFTQPDSITPSLTSQGLNLYSYVNNNPVNFTDPAGHQGIPTADKFYSTFYNKPVAQNILMGVSKDISSKATNGLNVTTYYDLGPADTITMDNISSGGEMAWPTGTPKISQLDAKSYTQLFWPVLGTGEFKRLQGLDTDVTIDVFENPYGLTLTDSQVEYYQNLFPPKIAENIKVIPKSWGLQNPYAYYLAVFMHLGAIANNYSVGVASDTGSMWPTMPRSASLYLQQKLSITDTLGIGDVVAFWDRVDGWQGQYESGYVAHRIVDTIGNKYILRGDNPDIPRGETQTARRDAIFGKIILLLDGANKQGFPIPPALH